MLKAKTCLICRLGYSFRYENLEYFLGKEKISTNYAALPTYFYLREKGEAPDLVILAVDFPSLEGFEVETEGRSLEEFLKEYERKVKGLGKERKIPSGVLEFARILDENGVRVEILAMNSPSEMPGPEDKFGEWKRIVNELREKLNLEGRDLWKIYLDLTHGFRPLSDLLWEAIRYLRVAYYEKILEVNTIYEFWSLISERCYPKELVGFEKCREIIESARYMIRYGILSKELIKELKLSERSEEALSSFYKDLRECDLVGVLKHVKELRETLEEFPRDPPAHEIFRMIKGEFSDLLALEDPDPTILTPEALHGMCLLTDWYLSKENVVYAAITSFEALRYGLGLLLSIKKGTFGKDLKGRGALQRILETSGLLLNAVGKGAIQGLFESVGGAELKKALILSSEAPFYVEELSEKLCNRLSLEDLAIPLLEKHFRKRKDALAKAIENLRSLEEFKSKVVGMSVINVVVDKIRDFLAHGGIAWTPRPRGEKDLDKVLQDVIRHNKREVLGLSSAFLKELANFLES